MMCPTCGGDGACTKCAGYPIRIDSDGNEFVWCDECNGDGWCVMCDGYGEVYDDWTDYYDFNISYR